MINVEWCLVELYKKYLFYVLNEVSDNVFYLCVLLKLNGEIWYCKKVVGREILGNVVKKIMKKVWFDGYYINYFFRCFCVIWLYDGGVLE